MLTEVPAGSWRGRAAAASGYLILGLVAWLLATGRWGSYVGLPHERIYISEIVIAISALLLAPAAFPRIVERRAKFLRARLEQVAFIASVLLLLWSLARLASGHVSLTALRDAAPYLYVVVAGLALVHEPRQRLASWVLTVGFLLHTVWLGVQIQAPGALPHTAVGQTQLFAIRDDFDSTVCGIVTAVAVLQLRRQRGLLGRIGWIVLGAANLALIAQLKSRAGLLASCAIVALAIVILLLPALHRSRSTSIRVATAIIACLMGILIAAGFVTQTTPGRRLANTFNLSTEAASGPAAAGGTSRARIFAWRKTTTYVLASPGRAAIGVGFGPDFLAKSGAAPYLEGTQFTGVRAPHDFWLNTWARLGAVGLALEIVLVGSGVGLAVRHVMHSPRSVPDVTAAGCLLAIPIAASLGVILESPFGAIPYFWALGYVLSTRQPESSTS